MNFQVGDVIDYKGHIAEIKELDREVPHSNGVKGALVEWSKKNLIPPQMIVPYADMLYVGTTNSPRKLGADWADLILDNEYQSINTDEKCPICDSRWKETWINKEPFYDCLKCNSTKEKIMEHYVGDLSSLDFNPNPTELPKGIK